MFKIEYSKKGMFVAIVLIAAVFGLFVVACGRDDFLVSPSPGRDGGAGFELGYEDGLGLGKDGDALVNQLSPIPNSVAFELPRPFSKRNGAVLGTSSQLADLSEGEIDFVNPDPEKLRVYGMDVLRKVFDSIDFISVRLALRFLELEEIAKGSDSSDHFRHDDLTMVLLTDELMEKWAGLITGGKEHPFYKYVNEDRYPHYSFFRYDNNYLVSTRAKYQSATIPGFADMFSSEKVCDRDITKAKNFMVPYRNTAYANAQKVVEELGLVTPDGTMDIKELQPWYFPGAWKVIWSKDGNEYKVKTKDREAVGVNEYIYRNLSEDYMVYRKEASNSKIEISLKRIVHRYFTGLYVRANFQAKPNGRPVIIEGAANDYGALISYRRHNILQTFDQRGNIVYDGLMSGASEDDADMMTEIRKVIRDNKQLDSAAYREARLRGGL